MQLNLETGLLDQAIYLPSPNCDDRAAGAQPETIIIHCISLPPGQYGGNAVIDFFTNRLDYNDHPYFAEISHLSVSAHFLVRRNGDLLQFVPTTKRAWHAGESVCLGRPGVNNFSIGIELEGLDTDPAGFSDQQYDSLRSLILCLKRHFPAIKTNNMFAHSDIAPGRKQDPGPYFLWNRLF
ncbi:MAG: 1,6-anhydro-N-acetylmuramyl-L-alanine amidase AmpD [Gammaproteobacteria bacterium]|nr:1,6-anhydro-N-acetylmuramyl-L-alanine amidase AmpD [Gammaproteobacteria bacterium]